MRESQIRVLLTLAASNHAAKLAFPADQSKHKPLQNPPGFWNSSLSQGTPSQAYFRSAQFPCNRMRKNWLPVLSSLRNDISESSFAAREVTDGFIQIRRRKVRPQRFADMDFCIADLPKQEVADAPLVGCSNQ